VLLTYVDDIQGERLNPKKVDHNLYLKAVDFNAPVEVVSQFDQDPSGAWIESYTLDIPAYQALKKLLSEQLQLTEDHFPTLPAGPMMKKGAHDKRLPILVAQLTQLGYGKDFNAQAYDKAMEEAVRRFLEDYDLEVDGMVGEETRSFLNNMDDQNRIQKIMVSMERWRWMSRDLGDRYIQVNIAAFMLQAVEQGKVALEMPVIIGQNYRKTPVFSSAIYNIRFNPSWHVPYSIAVEDKLEQIQSDPGYLSRKGFVVTDASGARVDPDSVDWSSLGPGNFPYHLRQRPGDHNALGKIRFSINSPFDVYLHSTPEKQLFLKKVRNFSSGCIRVAEPDQLAVFVFNDQQKWPLDVIQQHMEGNDTKEIKISKVPVHITYFTVWQNKDGLFEYAMDVYGQDERVWQALQNISQERKKSHA
jgi:murein L,D-transpeptidase YcbB/YkuD